MWPIRFIICGFIAKKSEQEFVRLKKLNLLENIATKTLQDSTILKFFFAEDIISSAKIAKIESEQKSDIHLESVGLGMTES